MDTQTLKYHSRNDIIILVCIFTTILILWPFQAVSALQIGFALLLIVLNLYIGYSIKYFISDDFLTVKALGYSKRIPIDEIKSIKRSYNPLSSPATSIRRLEVNYGKGQSVLISPKNENRFLRNLLDLNPNIEMKVDSFKNT